MRGYTPLVSRSDDRSLLRSLADELEDRLQRDDALHTCCFAAAEHRQQTGGLAETLEHQLQRVIGVNVSPVRGQERSDRDLRPPVAGRFLDVAPGDDAGEPAAASGEKNTQPEP